MSALKKQTEDIIKHHIWASMGTGLIPIPVADMMGLTGVQVNMLKKLAQAYDVPFFKEAVKNTLSSMVSGLLLSQTGTAVGGSLIKAIPVIGQIAGLFTAPILYGASTYATGKVYNQHFASGGTLLTFDPEKVKDYYAKMFEEGKKVAADMKKK